MGKYKMLFSTNTCQEGMGIAEVMISILISSIMIAGLAQLFVSQTQASKNTSKENFALWSAQNQLERLRTFVKDDNLGATCIGVNENEPNVKNSPPLLKELKDDCPNCAIRYEIKCYENNVANKWYTHVWVEEKISDDNVILLNEAWDVVMHP
jgi:Tfp pilus assembly protein PilX